MDSRINPDFTIKKDKYGDVKATTATIGLFQSQPSIAEIWNTFLKKEYHVSAKSGSGQSAKQVFIACPEKRLPEYVLSPSEKEKVTLGCKCLARGTGIPLEILHAWFRDTDSKGDPRIKKILALQTYLKNYKENINRKSDHNPYALSFEEVFALTEDEEKNLVVCSIYLKLDIFKETMTMEAIKSLPEEHRYMLEIPEEVLLKQHIFGTKDPSYYFCNFYRWYNPSDHQARAWAARPIQFPMSTPLKLK